MSADEVGQALASMVVKIAVEEDMLGCSDCRNELDVSDVETEEEALELMQEHARKYHDG